MRPEYQILPKSPPPLNFLAGSAPGRDNITNVPPPVERPGNPSDMQIAIALTTARHAATKTTGMCTMSAKTGGGHQPLVPKILHTRVTRDYLAAYVSKLRRASFQISCRRPRVFATAAMWSSDADCDASQHLFNPTKRDGAALWQTFTSVSTWRARAHNVTDRGRERITR